MNTATVSKRIQLLLTSLAIVVPLVSLVSVAAICGLLPATHDVSAAPKMALLATSLQPDAATTPAPMTALLAALSTPEVQPSVKD